MNRISNHMLNNTMIYNLQRHQTEMDASQNRLATGKNIRIPRDNPVAAGNQMLYNSRLTEVNQYIKNIQESQSRLEETDSAVQSALKIFQRVRVLAVQGGNGTYSTFERREAMAAEVDQLLEEMVAVANFKGATGRPVFGGYETGTEELREPFVPVYQTLTDGTRGEFITGVEYRGNTGKLLREVSKGEYMSVNIPGSQLFQATNQVLSSNTDASGYSASSNQVITIDGTDISITAGDNLDVVIDKINNAGLSVRASRGGRNNLVLESLSPHKLWLQDSGSGSVLKDLGMINPDSPEPPDNFSPTVEIGGMSVFEAMITIRDDLRRGDVELIGGRDLGLVDMAMDNILKHTAALGSKQSRVDELARRSEYEKTNVIDMISKTEGVDYAEEIMNFRWLESVHQYALSVGARTIKPTLMDFLR